MRAAFSRWVCTWFVGQDAFTTLIETFQKDLSPVRAEVIIMVSTEREF